MLCCLGFSIVQAQGTYTYQSDGYIPTHQIMVLPDEGDSLSVAEVVESNHWQPASTYRSLFGLRQKTAWVKLAINNQSDCDHLLLEYQVPYTRYIAYYNDIKATHLGPQIVTGTDKVQQRKYQSTYFLFDVPAAPGETAVLLFKIQSGHQLVFPFRLLDPAYPQNHSFWLRQLLYGMFVGIMLLTVLYNVIIFISTKNKVYLIYITYLVTVALTQFCLLGIYQNYFPLFGGTHNYLAYYFFVAAIGPCGLLFFFTFLNIDQRFPKLMWVLYGLLGSYTLAFILALANFHLLTYLFFQLNALISCPLAIVISAYMGFVDKDRPARLFMVGWLPLLLGNIVFISRDVGLLEPYEWTWTLMSYGTAFQAILLIAALSDLIHGLNHKHRASEKQRFQISRDNDQLRLGLKEARLNVLQRQMNPHFIFNALHSIQNHLDKYADNQAGTLLDEFSGLMRTSLIHSRQETVFLTEEIDFLETYLKVEQRRFKDGFDYHIEVDHLLDPREVSIIPLLLQPICENAIKHGFNSSGRRGMLNLKFYRENETSIGCTIKDNGIGFDTSGVVQKKKYKKDSLGLDLIKQRMGILKEQGFEADFSIQNSATSEPFGTLVTLILPDYELH